jgi:ornithine cyclodeaminase/alanine dehydrogenase-like protein (mu-crystallin family)
MTPGSFAAPLYLPETRVRELLDLKQLIPALEQALIDFSSGRVLQPLRSVVPIDQHSGWFGLMPAAYGDVFGAKLVTVFPRNAARGLHTHHALIQLFCAETGEPLATMDGRFITAWRTAAVSAIATRELSKPDARVLAILGSGVQAHTHFHGLQMVRSFSEVRVWSPTEEHARRFAGRIGASYMSAEQAVRGADVIVTATAAVEPIVRGAWVKPGAYVNAVGAIGPAARELDDELMRQAAVVVESRESARNESAEIVQSGVPVHAELGELLAGIVQRPGAPIIVYKSLGMAIEDLVAARLVYSSAVSCATRSPL